MEDIESPAALAGAHRAERMVPIDDAASPSNKTTSKDQAIERDHRAAIVDELDSLDLNHREGWKAAGQLIHQLVARVEEERQAGNGLVACCQCRFFEPLPKVTGFHSKSAADGTCRYGAPKATRPGSTNCPTVTRTSWCRFGQLNMEVWP
jgi:hypothetical protein